MENLMPKFLLARKIGMTQIFVDDQTVPVTVLEALSAEVFKVKTKEKDGYSAVVLKFDKKQKEFRVDDNLISNFKEGDKIDVNLFEKGELVNIRSQRKAKGFAGVVKRWGFAGGPRTHGQENKERAPGSIGQRWPQRVRRGLKMAGRIAPLNVTVKNLKIVDILQDKNLILVKGSVPGPNKRIVEIRSSFLTNQGGILLTKKIKRSLTKVS